MREDDLEMKNGDLKIMEDALEIIDNSLEILSDIQESQFYKANFHIFRLSSIFTRSSSNVSTAMLDCLNSFMNKFWPWLNYRMQG